MEKLNLEQQTIKLEEYHKLNDYYEDLGRRKILAEADAKNIDPDNLDETMKKRLNTNFFYAKDYRTKISYELFNPIYNYFNLKGKLTHLKDEDKLLDLSSLDSKLLNIKSSIQAEFDKPSVLRYYHADSIKYFLIVSPYNHGIYQEIAKWPDEKFKEWGCKTFEVPEKQNAFKKVINTLADKVVEFLFK